MKGFPPYKGTGAISASPLMVTDLRTYYLCAEVTSVKKFSEVMGQCRHALMRVFPPHLLPHASL